MIVCEVSTQAPWPANGLSVLAERSIAAALAASPQGYLADLQTALEVSVRFTSDDEVQTLNRQYRQQDKATNVLSFPMVQPDLIASLANTDDGEVLLGDVVLAHGVCVREAHERGASLEAHTAHLIVHGVLHLLGHDHMTDADADAMEAIERDAMTALGLHDPYPVED